MAKCLACKFDSCAREFERHKSHDSFSALDSAFSKIADVVGGQVAAALCDRHRATVDAWLKHVFVLYDVYRTEGVTLTRIVRR